MELAAGFFDQDSLEKQIFNLSEVLPHKIKAFIIMIIIKINLITLIL